MSNVEVPATPDLSAVSQNERLTPIMQTSDIEGLAEFYERIGFTVTYRQSRPYVYLAVQWRSVELHFGQRPSAAVDDSEDCACLVAVDHVASYHAAFRNSLKASLGRVPTTGRPRLTRFRPGASRFTLVDPSGNSVIFVQRNEPVQLQYGGAQSLTGLAKALDNARILREFKNDEAAAFRALDSALRRPKPEDSRIDRATALALMIDMAARVGKADRTAELAGRLRSEALTEAESEHILHSIPPHG